MDKFMLRTFWKNLVYLTPTDLVDLELVLFEVQKTFSMDEESLALIWMPQF